ncbi:MAG TPA: hypothetical protein VGG14_10360 [Candidatus Sulfotelmatobacter sp.]|jgi:hypothetical protein
MRFVAHVAKSAGILLTAFLFLLGSVPAVEQAAAISAGISKGTSSNPAPGNFDGPAELPRVYVNSALSETPAPGKVHLVKEGGDLQAALDSATCGDVISLQAGGSFPGRFRLPAKSCDDLHWIVIRTSAPDESLPPEGTRILPCYAGVASLPGRPDFHCSSLKNVMARITFTGKTGTGPIVFAPQANHYRLLGLEITRDSPGATINNLAGPEQDGVADHIVFDRVWMHGTAQDETTRGIFLTGTRFMAIVDSYFSDFHCVSVTGSCTDAQDIAGGAGDHPMGPFKIVNNFLEASGENIIFGGAAATATPADIEIRHNHFFKPMIWMPGHPGFVGGTSGRPFIVKNLFEIKNAQRVLFEGNILENSWGGVGQSGFGIVLTPKNQMPNVCPLCRVTDITLRYSEVRHVGTGIVIANTLSGSGGAATAGERYSIHDLLFEDIDGELYKGFGSFAMVISTAPPLRDIKIDHVTAFPPRVSFNLGSDLDKPPAGEFTFTNSILSAGRLEVTSTGGKRNCAYGAAQFGPAGVFKNCFSSLVFSHNAIIGPARQWPSGNFFPRNEDAVGFVNYNHGKDGDYRLCKGKNQPAPCRSPSPYLHAGTDGKDLGADIDAIKAATSGAL